MDDVSSASIKNVGGKEQLVDLGGSCGVEFAQDYRGVAQDFGELRRGIGRTARTSARARVGRYSGSDSAQAVSNQTIAEMRPRTSAVNAEASMTLPPITPRCRARQCAAGGSPHRQASHRRIRHRRGGNPYVVGAVLALLGLAGLVIGAAGGSAAAIALVSGVRSGAALFLGVGLAAKRWQQVDREDNPDQDGVVDEHLISSRDDHTPAALRRTTSNTYNHVPTDHRRT